MYSEAYGDIGSTTVRSENGSDKVDKICVKVREVLESAPNLKSSCFTVLLSTYIKLSKPQIDTALLRVKEILGKQYNLFYYKLCLLKLTVLYLFCTYT